MNAALDTSNNDLVSNVIDFGMLNVLLVIATPLEPTNAMVSKPLAIKSCCPAIFQVLKVEFMAILTLPEPRSVISKPEFESKRNPVTSVTLLEKTLASSIKLTDNPEVLARLNAALA